MNTFLWTISVLILLVSFSEYKIEPIFPTSDESKIVVFPQNHFQRDPLENRNSHLEFVTTTYYIDRKNSRELRNTIRFFSPSQKEVMNAEIKLEKNIGNLSPTIKSRYSSYGRQYLGYLNDQEEKILFINALILDGFVKLDDFRNRMVFVNDGGDYYWRIKFNLETEEFFDFEVNGDA